MRFVSLFAGVGGFDLAFERAGMECVGQVEIDTRCREVLATHWPDIPRWEDIHDVTAEDLHENGRPSVGYKFDSGIGGRVAERQPSPDSGLDSRRINRGTSTVDVLCGGFPCQDYSVAGKRGGLVGDRGALWWQFHRLIDECRPEWVVGENVPGLLSSSDGRDFGTIIGSLVELGYGVVWRILDAQYFGVAQRRRRVFIVGHIGGQPRPEILAFAEGCAWDTPPVRDAGQDPAGTLGAGFGAGGTPSEGYGALIATNGGGKPGQGYPAVHIAQTICSNPHNHSDPTTEARMHIFQGSIVRRLTPLECERLQGFPDNWTASQSDTQRYRQMGNAVALPVAEWIGHRLAAA